VLESTSGKAADVVLLAPILIAIVALAAACAPLARRDAPTVAGVGLLLLAAHGALITLGMAWAASLPGAVGAVLLGVAGARMVRRIIWTIPILVAGALSDVHGVAVGLTSELVDDVTGVIEVRADVGGFLWSGLTSIAPIDLLTLHLPAASGIWLLGLVDVVAVGLLLGLAHLMWTSVLRSAAALAIALVLVVLATQVVPVIPILAASWLLANAPTVWRAARFSLRRLAYLGG
jgi:hypothetical protein